MHCNLASQNQLINAKSLSKQIGNMAHGVLIVRLGPIQNLKFEGNRFGPKQNTKLT